MTASTNQTSNLTLDQIIISEKDAAEMLCLSVGSLQKDRSTYKRALKVWDAAGRKSAEPKVRIPFVQISDNRVGYRVSTLHTIAEKLEVGS